ncbi:hypothetical protein J6590_048140 [Homalodisca vitripennis]|nr:hypothetical protein J6590_048140 [Homalodisca vitripennis]
MKRPVHLPPSEASDTGRSHILLESCSSEEIHRTKKQQDAPPTDELTMGYQPCVKTSEREPCMQQQLTQGQNNQPTSSPHNSTDKNTDTNYKNTTTTRLNSSHSACCRDAASARDKSLSLPAACLPANKEAQNELIDIGNIWTKNIMLFR